MALSSSDVSISDVDQERFGIKTARSIGLTKDQLPAVLDFCRKGKVVLLIARCNMKDLETAQSLEKEGFLLMDTLVYYSFDLVKPPPVSTDPGVARIRILRPGEEEDVIRIAQEAFRGYLGHYHADKRLNKSQCDEAYVDWTRKACAARESENFLIAEIDGKIVGYGVQRMNNAEEGEYYLGGIHPDFQGRRLYHSFLCKAREWFLSQGAKKMLISTQLQNIPVQKVLIRFGFEISKGYYTYHKWFDE
jgi:ribosomal protein S18 acetylase RimI-like enzyme